MDEVPFRVAAGDGFLEGHAGGTGVPALLLHGGPGLPDSMAGCAADLGRLFTTIRYTQRGTAPSTAGPPFTVEAHMVDALPVFFAHGIADPLPLRSSTETARLVPGAKVARIPGCGHFPWLEQPGFLERGIHGLTAQL